MRIALNHSSFEHCSMPHIMYIGRFNEKRTVDMDTPTISDSILRRARHFSPASLSAFRSTVPHSSSPYAQHPIRYGGPIHCVNAACENMLIRNGYSNCIIRVRPKVNRNECQK